MALDVVGTCSAASSTSDVPGLAIFLAVAFFAVLALDSLLAASIIVRKSAEAEVLTGKVLQGMVM